MHEIWWRIFLVKGYCIVKNNKGFSCLLLLPSRIRNLPMSGNIMYSTTEDFWKYLILYELALANMWFDSNVIMWSSGSYCYLQHFTWWFEQTNICGLFISRKSKNKRYSQYYRNNSKQLIYLLNFIVTRDETWYFQYNQRTPTQSSKCWQWVKISLKIRGNGNNTYPFFYFKIRNNSTNADNT